MILHQGITAGSPAHRTAIRYSLLAASFLAASIPGHSAESSTAGLAFFESKIRPLLADHCYSCHSTQAEKSGRTLRGFNRGSAQRGRTGPGDCAGRRREESAHQSRALHRPGPPDAAKNKRLSDRQIADLTRWVQSGAPWPATDRSSVSRPTNSTHQITRRKKAGGPLIHPSSRSPARPS